MGDWLSNAFFLLLFSVFIFPLSLKTTPEVEALDIISYWIYVYEWDFSGWSYSHMATQQSVV